MKIEEKLSAFLDLIVGKMRKVPARYISIECRKDLAAILDAANPGGDYRSFADLNGVTLEELQETVMTRTGNRSPFCNLLDLLIQKQGDHFTIFTVHDTLRQMDSPGQRVLLAFMKGKLLIDLAVERKMRIPARFIPKKLCKDLAAILEDAKNSYGIFAVFSGIVPEDLRLWLKTQSQNAPGHTSPFCLVLDYLVNRHGDDFTIFAVYDTLRKMDSPGQHVLLDFMRGRVLLDLAIEEKMKNVPAKRLPSHLRTEIAAILDSCENPPGRDHSSFALHCGISQDKLQVLVEKGNDLDRGPFCTVLDYVIGKLGDEFTIFTVYNILREMASPGQHVLLDFMRDYPAGVPVFSEDWQTCEHFSNAGGQLKAEDSDVILHVPEDAVPPGPTCTTVRGAVSTDLTIIHKELSLNENETIASPVVEYFAGRNHRFLRPVRIVLPHCLPPSYSQDKVRVYRFHRDSFGCTKVEKLDPLKADEDSQTGYFLVPETREVHILTYHFTGYFCTYCNVEKEPPFLRLRLYGKHLHRRTRDVDLWLFIWDTRLDVRDFRKAGFPNPEEEKNFITCKTLDGTRNVAELELGVRLLLSEEEEVKWMHKENRGTPWLPPEKRLQLSSFVPCCKDTIPTRVDWTLRSRPEQTPDRWFECFIEVGYVKEDDAVMRFLDKPQKQILPVSGLELQNEHKVVTTQTQDNVDVNTHVKLLTISSPPLPSSLRDGTEAAVPWPQYARESMDTSAASQPRASHIFPGSPPHQQLQNLPCGGNFAEIGGDLQSSSNFGFSNNSQGCAAPRADVHQQRRETGSNSSRQRPPAMGAFPGHVMGNNRPRQSSGSNWVPFTPQGNPGHLNGRFTAPGIAQQTGSGAVRPPLSLPSNGQILSNADPGQSSGASVRPDLALQSQTRTCVTGDDNSVQRREFGHTSNDRHDFLPPVPPWAAFNSSSTTVHYHHHQPRVYNFNISEVKGRQIDFGSTFSETSPAHEQQPQMVQYPGGLPPQTTPLGLDTERNNFSPGFAELPTEAGNPPGYDTPANISLPDLTELQEPMDQCEGAAYISNPQCEQLQRLSTNGGSPQEGQAQLRAPVQCTQNLPLTVQALDDYQTDDVV